MNIANTFKSMDKKMKARIIITNLTGIGIVILPFFQSTILILLNSILFEFFTFKTAFYLLTNQEFEASKLFEISNQKSETCFSDKKHMLGIIWKLAMPIIVTSIIISLLDAFVFLMCN